jgi:hypothetical protein
MYVKVDLEFEQLALEIRSCPEQHTIQTLAADGADQPLHKLMEQRNIGYGLDFAHIQDSQVGLPSMKAIERIVVGAEVFRQRVLASNCAAKHSAERIAIHRTCMDAEPNDPPG